MQLLTERLFLIPLQPDGMRTLIARTTDPELIDAYNEMLTLSLQHPERWLWYTAWGMYQNDSGDFVGDLCFKGLPENGQPEIGYGVLKECEGQGYATEAAAAVRDYWFGTVGAPWLAGFHASQNVASSRVLAKTGFHYDHDTVLHRFDGTEVPCLAWYLLNPGSQKSDEPAAAAPAVQAEPTEPAENAETTV